LVNHHSKKAAASGPFYIQVTENKDGLTTITSPGKYGNTFERCTQ